MNYEEKLCFESPCSSVYLSTTTTVAGIFSVFLLSTGTAATKYFIFTEDAECAEEEEDEGEGEEEFDTAHGGAENVLQELILDLPPLSEVLSIHSDKANGDTLLFVALRSPDSGTSVLASSLRVFLLTAPQHSTESITLCATFIQQFPLDFRPISLQILSSQTMSFLLVTGSDDFILHIYHIERDGRLSRNQDVRESLRMQWEHRLDLVSMKYKSVCLHIMIEDHHGIGSQGLATFSNGCLVFDHSSYKDISVSGRKYTDSTVHKGIDQLKTSHLTLLFDGVISCVKCISLAEQSISGASSRHRFSSLAIVGLSTGKVFIVGLITDSRLELDPVGGHGGVQAIAASNTISDLAIAVGYFDGTVSMYVFYPYRSAFIKTWQYVFPFPVYSLFTRVSPQTNSNIIIVTTAKTIHLLENCV